MDALCLSPSVQQVPPFLGKGVLQMLLSLFCVSPPSGLKIWGSPSALRFGSVHKGSTAPAVGSVVLVSNLHLPKAMVLRT